MGLLQFSRTHFSSLSCIVLVGLIIGCSDGSSPSDSLGVEVSRENFDAFQSSGLWGRTFESKVSFDMTVAEVTAVYELDIKGKDITSIDARDQGKILSDNCDEYGFEEIDLVDEESIEEDFPACDGESTIKFYKVDDSNYSITLDCDADRLATLRMNKISDSHIFEGNSLSFRSESLGDIDSSTGVCGMISNIYQSVKVTPEPNSLNETSEAKDVFSILVAAPYQGDRIVFEIDYDGNFQTGKYSVSETLSEGEIGTMHVEVISFAFGAFGDSPVSYSATDGKVTILELTESKAVGSFDITLSTGAELEGSFSLDLSR